MYKYKIGDIVYVRGDSGTKIKSKIVARHDGEYICLIIDNTITPNSINITILNEEHMSVLRTYGVPENALGKPCAHSDWGLWQHPSALSPCDDEYQEVVSSSNDSGGFNLL